MLDSGFKGFMKKKIEMERDLISLLMETDSMATMLMAKGMDKGCIACHQNAGGDDFVYANDF